MLADTLKKVVDDTPGAIGAILMGFDGIAVMQHVSDPRYDIESVAMEMSFRFMELRCAAETLDIGRLADVTIKTERATLLCRILSDEYFVCVVLEDSAHFGKGRWILRSAVTSLLDEL